MRALGKAARSPGRVLFTGGATAVLIGWRETTIDIDIKLVPDQDTILRAIPALKESLHINVELASRMTSFLFARDGRTAARCRAGGTPGPLSFRVVAQALPAGRVLACHIYGTCHRRYTAHTDPMIAPP